MYRQLWKTGNLAPLPPPPPPSPPPPAVNTSIADIILIQSQGFPSLSEHFGNNSQPCTRPAVIQKSPLTGFASSLGSGRAFSRLPGHASRRLITGRLPDEWCFTLAAVCGWWSGVYLSRTGSPGERPQVPLPGDCTPRCREATRLSWQLHQMALPSKLDRSTHSECQPPNSWNFRRTSFNVLLNKAHKDRERERERERGRREGGRESGALELGGGGSP